MLSNNLLKYQKASMMYGIFIRKNSIFLLYVKTSMLTQLISGKSMYRINIGWNRSIG